MADSVVVAPILMAARSLLIALRCFLEQSSQFPGVDSCASLADTGLPIRNHGPRRHYRAEAAVRLQKGDILIALKAINLTPGIRNGDRALAAALLDHFNRKTGQCDPSIPRLATLLGCSERTIFRSLNRIEADRLFKRTSHGGHLNRNSYEPNWQRFREIEAIWSGRMKQRRAAPTSVSDTSRQACQLEGDKSVIQTCRRNLSKATYQVSLPRRESNRDASSNSQRRLSFQTPSRLDAVHTAAQRRWHADLHREFSALPITYSQVLQEIDQAMEAAATDAEKLKPGAGLQYICEQLGLPTPDAGGNP